ncbi:hypothetical protein [Helicobacter cetorum]|uniref:Uncharacterized protein n=1 Tax=Helicobacter cetorum (strain ATCC BAA-540 / CCUG 52418 / MIT 99-5656) TaxID=1163745 RepID=I0ESU1_HELCM|nr:hypothetical protein [Helicobacter cetorum]AFI05214.1 hypothetical protein HCD_00910 [Helicobacter cetorum MIT 99-5656]AFI06010.1 hypothetical protein HCD_05040 [Helicobacter cetorum MIT 99-5656]
MANYYPDITAGRGGLALYNESLNHFRNLNANLSNSIANLSQSISNSGAFIDNAKLKQDALNYQKQQDALKAFKEERAYNDALNLQNKQMEFAKNRQAFDNLKTQALVNNYNASTQASNLQNRVNQLEVKRYEELLKPLAKVSPTNKDTKPSLLIPTNRM